MTAGSSLRVLFFAHESTLSGAPIQLWHLVRWLKHQGWEVAVAVPKTGTAEAGPISEWLNDLGIQTFPIIDLSACPNFTELGELCSRFDVVIANTLVMWAPVRAASERGIRTIWYIHESQVAHHLVAHIPELRPTLALATLLVMPTHRTAQLYATLTERPIEVVPYGIPKATPLDGRRGKDDRVHFLLLGTYEPRKGQDIYLAAIKRLGELVPGRFAMAGRVLDSGYYERLSQHVAFLSNVHLGSSLSHDEALAATAATDVLVCASRDETMPIAILEAMSLGKAIVSTRVGGVEEWLEDGVNALLTPPEDSEALAQAMARCLHEPELVSSLGQRARHTFEKSFSIDCLGQRFSALIRRVREAKAQ